MATAAVHGLVPCLCVGVFEFHYNHPQLAGGKKKKKGKMGKKKFRRKRGVVALMRDEINCTFCFHMYPIEVYLSEDAQQCGSSSVYSVRSDGVCYIGFPASHWL